MFKNVVLLVVSVVSGTMVAGFAMNTLGIQAPWLGYAVTIAVAVIVFFGVKAVGRARVGRAARAGLASS